MACLEQEVKELRAEKLKLLDRLERFRQATLATDVNTSVDQEVTIDAPMMPQTLAEQFGNKDYLHAVLSQLLTKTQPSARTHLNRNGVVSFLKRLVHKRIFAQFYPHGSYGLNTYLASDMEDGRIDLCVFTQYTHEATVAKHIVAALCDSFRDEADAETDEKKQKRKKKYVVDHIVISIPDRSKNIIENPMVECNIITVNATAYAPQEVIKVRIQSNQLSALGEMALVEHVDGVVANHHLFKRSIILAKNWALRNNLLGPGKLSGAFFRALMLCIFNIYHAEVQTELHTLVLMLTYLQEFNWEDHALTIHGPVTLESLAPVTSEESQEQAKVTRGYCALSPNTVPLIGPVALKPFLVPSQGPVFISGLTVIDPVDPCRNLTADVPADKVRGLRVKLTEGCARFLQAHKQYLAIADPDAGSISNETDSMPRSFAFSNTLGQDPVSPSKEKDSKSPIGANSAQDSVEHPMSIETNPLLLALFPVDFLVTCAPSILPMETKRVSNPTQSTGTDPLKASEARLMSNLSLGRTFRNPGLSEDDLIEMCKGLLLTHGPMAVGKLGGLLHETTGNHSLPLLLKELYGGLKRLLAKHHAIFTLAKDHPLNPVVTLKIEKLAVDRDEELLEHLNITQQLPHSMSNLSVSSSRRMSRNDSVYSNYSSMSRSGSRANMSSWRGPNNNSENDISRSGSRSGSVISRSGSVTSRNQNVWRPRHMRGPSGSTSGGGEFAPRNHGSTPARASTEPGLEASASTSSLAFDTSTRGSSMYHGGMSASGTHLGRARNDSRSRKYTRNRPLSNLDVTDCLAITCKLVGVGNEGRNVLARCSVVNYDGDVVYDKFIKPPEPITDYRTDVSGILPEHVESESAVPFVQCQRTVSVLLKSRIVVGHSVESDLQALLLHHPRRLIRDTTLRGSVRKLVTTSQPSTPIDSVEAARSAMVLYKSCHGDWDLLLRTQSEKGSVSAGFSGSQSAPSIPNSSRDMSDLASRPGRGTTS